MISKKLIFLFLLFFLSVHCSLQAQFTSGGERIIDRSKRPFSMEQATGGVFYNFSYPNNDLKGGGLDINFGTALVKIPLKTIKDFRVNIGGGFGMDYFKDESSVSDTLRNNYLHLPFYLQTDFHFNILKHFAVIPSIGYSLAFVKAYRNLQTSGNEIENPYLYPHGLLLRITLKIGPVGFYYNKAFSNEDIFNIDCIGIGLKFAGNK